MRSARDRCVGRYTLDTLQLVDKFTLKKNPPYAIDISGNELYVYEYDIALKIFNLNTKVLIRQWSTPTRTAAIKIHGGNLYYVGFGNGIIYIYNLSGGLIKQFGKGGSGNGEFSGPYGIDVDEKFIYIADSYNFRIQVFHLNNCTYSHQWESRKWRWTI